MAGESPDKSVDEGASGTAEPATPRAERDPRLSVLRPREEAEPGDRDPLKEAVAAWVATESSQGPADRAPARTPAEPSQGPADRAPAPTPAEPEADSTAPAVPADRRPTKPGAAAPSDAAGRDSAKASGSGEPEKTAFGVAKPGSAAAEGKPAGEPR
ncbi:hypothetical protein AB0A79_23310, partial [Streptomyces sp. NPDC046161]